MDLFFENSQIVRLLLALGLGFFLGIRRELDLQEKNYKSFMGIRTMAILCVFGTISTFVPTMPMLPVILFSGIFFLVLAAYIYNSFVNKHMGMTSGLVALMTYWVGVFIGVGDFLLAIFIAIFLGIVNEFRDDIHKFIQTLTPAETKGALKLLILSGAILPLLPQTAIDPWGVLVPFKIWLLVIFISGLGFLGYFLSKYFSQKGGTLLASFLGAIVSSTAVTASLAEKSKRMSSSRILGAGILLSIGIMQIRALLEIVVIGGDPFRDAFLLVPLSMAAASGLGSFHLATKKASPSEKKAPKSFQLSSPFELLPALKFGFIFVLVLLGIFFAKKFLGNSGVYIASAISAIVDVDAIILSSLESNANGEISIPVAQKAIMVALIVNTLIKIAYIGLLGSRDLLRKMTGYMLFISAIGVGAFFAI